MASAYPWRRQFGDGETAIGTSVAHTFPPQSSVRRVVVGRRRLYRWAAFLCEPWSAAIVIHIR